jgi:hypothetical protein
VNYCAARSVSHSPNRKIRVSRGGLQDHLH